jgi:uncharacterized protein YecE (DUF72 family)
MKAYVGTSGFSYKEWKGSFYPDDLPVRGMLSYYADRLTAVEINNTFYRMPNVRTLEGWADQTPPGFEFVLKASRKITHFKKLAGTGDELEYLVPTAQVLGDKLGPMLFQLPPYLKKDLGLLEAFLSMLPNGFRAAFEFRSTSWLSDDVYGALADRSVALVAADADKEELLAVRRTAPFGYARLRRMEYDDRALDEWAERLVAQGWDSVYVFFKHEDEGAGPRMAGRFLELLGGAGT